MKRLVVIAATCLVLAGCATDAPPADDGVAVPLPQPIEPEVAPTLLTSRFGEIGDSSGIDGELGVNVFNCVTIDGRLLVAPLGSTIDGLAIAVAGYGSFAIGESISVAGGFSDDVAVSDLDDEFVFCIPGDDSTADLAYIAPKGR